MGRLLVAVLIGAIGFGFSASAQTDTSLTREFGHLSAKERARIAKNEQQEAMADTRYQAVMAEAEGFFQQKRYDESLDRYQAARAMRPLNVYPKVKIQDLQAFIAKRDAALAEAARDSLKAAAVAPLPAKPDSVPVTIVAKPVEPRPVEHLEPVQTERPKEVPKEPVRIVPRESVVPEKRGASTMKESVPVSDGLEERTYVEGRAIVLERRLTRHGRLEVYRKVSHPWGQVVHFRDGVAISEREWAEVFQ